jgi:hypothetical protein
MTKRSLIAGRSSAPDPDQPTGLREKLWKLFSAVLDRCLAEARKKDCSPAVLAICVSLLKFNDVRVTKVQGTVYMGLEGLVRRAGLATPFTPGSSAASTTTKKNEDDDE